MASEGSNRASKPMLQGEPSESGHLPMISDAIALKDQIQRERTMDMKRRIAEVAKRLACHLDGFQSSTTNAHPTTSNNESGYQILPSPAFIAPGFSSRTDKRIVRIPEEFLSQSVNLPRTEKIPCYTTWTLLQRNQRMTEDQSVKGKRRIYYESNGNEALVCSDSGEDNPDQEEKCEFSEGEDRILRLAFEKHGANDKDIEKLEEIVGATSLQMRERYKELKEKFPSNQNNDSGTFLEKRLSDAMDSFDTLFCRRCMVFDCRLHGCSQPLIFPSDRKPSQSEPEAGSSPCGDKCYLRKQVNEIEGGCNWKTMEKDLLRKGIEIFGKKSCQIARNLLSGMKTCVEVNDYLHRDLALTTGDFDGMEKSFFKDERGAISQKEEQETPMRPRPIRRRGKAHRRKYSLKSTTKKRSDDGLGLRQYTPCSCQPICGKNCPCLDAGNCCEKYCGCSSSCKNRFRGCHCAKGQCRTQKCPCFASSRECDPDICRNCWVSCGDGSAGEPPKQGDGQCGNMRILLGQQKGVILGKSDVAGWGAFIQVSVNKHDYIGEYTGELISHDEAERRGEVYDRMNSSFLFNLNDQWCIDACRKGNNLKFANHSPKPNCYCQILLVGGEHRVGIFAKEQIPAFSELFFDYSYGDAGPSWARDPEKDEASSSRKRAKKNQTS